MEFVLVDYASILVVQRFTVDANCCSCVFLKSGAVCSKRCPVAHCRMLPPVKFNIMTIAELY